MFSLQMMLWMMFGCKYVNQTLEALGSGHADKRGMLKLLNDLQQMEYTYYLINYYKSVLWKNSLCLISDMNALLLFYLKGSLCSK